MWFPGFPGYSLHSTAVLWNTGMTKKKGKKGEGGVLKAFPSVVHFSSAYEALLFPLLCCLYHHNKAWCSILLQSTEGPVRDIIFCLLHLFEYNWRHADIWGFLLYTRKNQTIRMFVFMTGVSVFPMGGGDWHTKEEIDNSSKAFKLYWCTNGVSCQLDSS